MKKTLILISQSPGKAIQKVQPEDKRPFAQYLKYEVNNPDIPALCYKVALYKQDGHCRTPLYFQRKQQFMKGSIFLF